ncbi:MAG: acetamidase/formamidase family protein [Defluviitaleaceae bacterium]|nr:acetamidase/formamidase family protein [Defluviitaleaceae bacterium]
MYPTITNSNYSFSKENEPAATVPSGTTVKFSATDAFGGQITRQNAKDGLKNFDWNRVNPAAGPLKVEGAQPGDVLKVEILDIQITGDTAVLMTGNALGVCKEFFDDNHIRVVDIADGCVVFSPEIKLPIRPMVGVIGVAPAAEAVNNGTPGEHGGNMDCKEITAGSTLYLPVNVEGALLSIGDAHAAMADGESSGTGAEAPADILVKVEVLKNCPWPTPLIENDTHYMPLASALTADEAIDNAVLKGVGFLMNTQGMTRFDAITLISLAADVRICQVVDPLKTARLNIQKSLLKQN